MKTTLMLIFAALTTGYAFGQRNMGNDPSYSVSNYKHPNKAAYAKKYELQTMMTVPEIMTVQNDNYKQSNRRVRVVKIGTVVRNDRYRTYPNDKHPHKKGEITPLNTEGSYNAVALNP